MNLHLPRYREVKNKYCVCYFGPCDEYVTLLDGLRPQAEQQLPGLQVYIGCKEHLCNGERFVSEKAAFQMVREPWGTQFGHIKEIRCDMKSHPVQQFFNDSGIKINPTGHKPDTENRLVKLAAEGISPTRSLTEEEKTKLTKKYASQGYVVREDCDWRDAGVVVGVESVAVWSAALEGKMTHLCDTGLGTGFFRVICPWGAVISI
jgi:hypothetical protein